LQGSADVLPILQLTTFLKKYMMGISKILMEEREGEKKWH